MPYLEVKIPENRIKRYTMDGMERQKKRRRTTNIIVFTICGLIIAAAVTFLVLYLTGVIPAEFWKVYVTKCN